MTIPQPSVGRIVHYFTDPIPQEGGPCIPAECRAAIVTRVWDDPDHETVAVTEFSVDNIAMHLAVPHNEGQTHGNSWHWPERVEQHVDIQVTGSMLTHGQAADHIRRQAGGGPR